MEYPLFLLTRRAPITFPLLSALFIDDRFVGCSAARNSGTIEGLFRLCTRNCPLEIEKDCVVSFHYALSENGNPLEDSKNADPMACLIGGGNIIPGLEEAMIGRNTGDSFTVTVPPEQAYGERNPNMLTRVAAKQLGVDARKLKPGMVLRVQTRRGPQMMRVIKAGRFMVNLDANHPMAGMTLTFEVSIEEVRKATSEELEHGHAHGVGGHNHD